MTWTSLELQQVKIGPSSQCVFNSCLLWLPRRPHVAALGTTIQVRSIRAVDPCPCRHCRRGSWHTGASHDLYVTAGNHGLRHRQHRRQQVTSIRRCAGLQRRQQVRPLGEVAAASRAIHAESRLRARVERETGVRALDTRHVRVATGVIVWCSWNGTAHRRARGSRKP